MEMAIARKAGAVALLVGILGLYTSFGRAESLALGMMTLAGKVLELDDLTIIATGNASFVSSSPDTPMKAGTTRLESIKAESIRLDLIKGKDGKLALGKALVTGGVIIKAKRADRKTGQTDGSATTVRDILATAQTATLEQGQDAVVLRGGVVVKVTDPKLAGPIARLTGETVTISLKDNKMRVEGPPGKHAELILTPEEAEKK